MLLFRSINMRLCFSEERNGKIRSTKPKMINRIVTFEKGMEYLATNEVSNDQKIISLGGFS